MRLIGHRGEVSFAVLERKRLYTYYTSIVVRFQQFPFNDLLVTYQDCSYV